MCAAVWIVFDTLNLGWNTILDALEINKAVMLLVTTTLMPCGDATHVIAPTIFGFLFCQRSMRLTLVQVIVPGLDYKSFALTIAIVLPKPILYLQN